MGNNFVFIWGFGGEKQSQCTFIDMTQEKAVERAQQIINRDQREETMRSPIATRVVIGKLYQEMQELSGISALREIPTRLME